MYCMYVTVHTLRWPPAFYLSVINRIDTEPISFDCCEIRPQHCRHRRLTASFEVVCGHCAHSAAADEKAARLRIGCHCVCVCLISV